MTIHPFYIGCDISNAHLDFYNPRTDESCQIPNDSLSIQAWIDRLAASVSSRPAHIIFEATGRYDHTIRQALAVSDIAYTRINPTQARRFAQAAGFLAKTDAVDARMLSALGTTLSPDAHMPPDPVRESLCNLQTRRDRLVTIRAAERTSLHKAHPQEAASIARHIAWLDAEIAAFDTRIADWIAAHPDLTSDSQRLSTAPGVGPVTCQVLLGQLPELGHRTPGQIAALAGVAPINNDSGAFRGKRKIRGGRRRVRRALYMAALAAKAKDPHFKHLYDRVYARSGVKKVAIIAVARKLLVTLNAMQRDKVNFAR